MTTRSPARTLRRDAVEYAAGAVLAMTPAELVAFLDALAGLPCVEAAGWRVREKRLSQERYPDRNQAIRAARQRGRTLGELAMDFGLSKSGIRSVLRRGNVCPSKQRTHLAQQ